MTHARPLALLLLLSAAFAAEEPAEQPRGLRANADQPFASTGEDPTRLPTRLGLAYESTVNTERESNTDAYLATGSVALLGFQAEAEVPLYSRYNPGAGDTVTGFGDVFVSGSFSLPFNPKFRMVAGVDAWLETASEDGIGNDESRYSPFLGMGAELDDRNLAVGRFSYTAGSDHRYELWQLLVRGVHRFNDQLFTAVELTPGYESEQDEFTIGARAIVGARIDKHNVASLETVQPLDSDTRDLRGWSLRLSYHFMF